MAPQYDDDEESKLDPDERRELARLMEMDGWTSQQRARVNRLKAQAGIE